MDSTHGTPHVEPSQGAAYALGRELGRGGMATVYLAHDHKHDRKVAVKVLHAELAAVMGAERFLAEIRVTANLQHPHILGLIDSGIFGPDANAAVGADGAVTAGSLAGRPYYVMPYVAGESLRARLTREGQLPVADALRIAREVASALDYAHRRGIVHRDVKPENVLLNDDGQALVADFGIALAVEQAGGARLTQTGLSVGTPAYMSPEQAMAERQVTARADVYALGAVLYELLAGEPPFTGPTAQAVIARVLTEAPRSLSSQRPSVPSTVDAAVRTALEKLPADRFPSTAAFAAALAASAGAEPPRNVTARALPPRTAALVIAGVMATIALAGTTGWWARGRATAAEASVEPVRFALEPDSGSLRITSPAISPDGRMIVFASYAASGSRLYARGVHELASRPLAGTDGGEWPIFSPDGAWVAFHSHGALRKVRLEGGPVVQVVKIPTTAVLFPGAWGEDDTIFYGTANGALFRVPAAGDTAERVAVRDSAVRLFTAQMLPGGRSALVALTRGLTQNGVGVQMGVLDFSTGNIRQLGQGAAPRYVPGYLVYGDGDAELYRRPFDLDRLEPTGPAEQIASNVQSSGYSYMPSFDVSASGALVYRIGSTPAPSIGRMTMTDRMGREVKAFPARAPWTPRFSPDGRRVVYGANAPGSESSDVWITDLAAGTAQRLTADAKDNNDPAWSPDGRSVVYSSIRAATTKDLFVQALDGSGPRRVTTRGEDDWPSDWSPDGNALMFTRVSSDDDYDIWIQPVDGSVARPYLATAAHESGARVSPDGEWAAYTSDETGRDEVYVQSYPSPGYKTVVSPLGGAHPVWRRDGRGLYYWQDDQLIAVNVTRPSPRGSLVVSDRSLVFRAPYVQGPHPNYDVSQDGTRFVLVTGPARPNRLVVALNALAGRPNLGGRR